MIIIEEGEENVLFSGGSVLIQPVKNQNGISKAKVKENAEYLDASLVKYPLLLRKWKQGDYFYPLGFRKKKKVARFLIDNKVSPVQKENTWVLESDKRICWILGMRIDDRFKIKDTTRTLLKFVYQT